MPTKTKEPRRILRRQYLINYRFVANLTQEKVAEGIGVALPTYNAIENGKQGNLMNAPKLVALAAILNVKLDELCAQEIAYLDKVNSLNKKEE